MNRCDFHGKGKHEGYRIRNVTARDYVTIKAVADGWWGRPIYSILHPNYCLHFADTGFVAECGTDMVAFLLGFVSQSRSGWGHIHAVSVHPQWRGHGVGRRLYESFFAAVRARGCSYISAMTSPCNSGSIDFHRALGFIPVKEDTVYVNGVPAVRDLAGPDEHRVCFELRLTP